MKLKVLACPPGISGPPNLRELNEAKANSSSSHQPVPEHSGSPAHSPSPLSDYLLSPPLTQKIRGLVCPSHTSVIGWGISLGEPRNSDADAFALSGVEVTVKALIELRAAMAGGFAPPTRFVTGGRG